MTDEGGLLMLRAPHLDQLSSLIVPLPLILSHFLCVCLSPPPSLTLSLYFYLSPRLRHFTLDVSASLSSKHFIFLNYHYHFSTSQLHQFNKTIEIQDFCITALLPNLMEGV